MGLLDSIRAKFAEMSEKSSNKEEFRALLFTAVEDGALSVDEIHALQDSYTSLGLVDEDIKQARVQAYTRMLGRVASDGIVTADEAIELSKLEALLKIPPQDIARDKARLSRLRLVSEIQLGNPPIISVPTMAMQKAEVAHWREPAWLLEERVVSRTYVGSSTGVSFRLMKGVTYRVGQSRGRVVTDSAIMKTSSGSVVLTNRRIVFAGDTKSFAIALDKVLDVAVFSDALRIDRQATNAAVGERRERGHRWGGSVAGDEPNALSTSPAGEAARQRTIDVRSRAEVVRCRGRSVARVFLTIRRPAIQTREVVLTRL